MHYRNVIVRAIPENTRKCCIKEDLNQNDDRIISRNIELLQILIIRYYIETLNGLTKLVVKYMLNRGTSLSISYRSHQIHSQLIL